MKLQVCDYKVHYGDTWKRGAAIMNHEFSLSDVKVIINEQGDKLPNCWDYQLLDGPMCYLDTERKS